VSPAAGSEPLRAAGATSTSRGTIQASERPFPPKDPSRRRGAGLRRYRRGVCPRARL